MDSLAKPSIMSDQVMTKNSCCCHFNTIILNFSSTSQASMMFEKVKMKVRPPRGRRVSKIGRKPSKRCRLWGIVFSKILFFAVPAKKSSMNSATKQVFTGSPNSRGPHENLLAMIFATIMTGILIYRLLGKYIALEYKSGTNGLFAVGVAKGSGERGKITQMNF